MWRSCHGPLRRGVGGVGGARWVRAYTAEPASSKLFRDAEREERGPMAPPSSLHDALNDPVWTGEERMEDTVLRMLVDKYKPMRRGESGREAEQARLQKTQQPTPQPHRVTGNVDANGVVVERYGDQPWNLVYTKVPTAEARVHRGTVEKPLAPPASAMRTKLQQMGVSPAQLAQQKPERVRAVRKALRTTLDKERVQAAMERKARYGAENPADDADADPNRPLLGVISAAKGLTGLAEMRIEEAIRKGTFSKNSLHGKPIPYDHHEGNGHLRREEFFLNRMVQRQGAAPPWVELNKEMTAEEQALRQRILTSWITRALYRLESANDWRRMEPIRVAWAPSAQGSDIPQYTLGATTDAQQRLAEWAAAFRDGTWVKEQSAYHTEAVHQLNQIIRRYNHIAPSTARRLLYTKTQFLQDTLDRAYPLLLEAASARLRGLYKAPPAAAPATPAAASPLTSWFRRRFT